MRKRKSQSKLADANQKRAKRSLSEFRIALKDAENKNLITRNAIFSIVDRAEFDVVRMFVLNWKSVFLM